MSHPQCRRCSGGRRSRHVVQTGTLGRYRVTVGQRLGETAGTVRCARLWLLEHCRLWLLPLRSDGAVIVGLGQRHRSQVIEIGAYPGTSLERFRYLCGRHDSLASSSLFLVLHVAIVVVIIVVFVIFVSFSITFAQSLRCFVDRTFVGNTTPTSFFLVMFEESATLLLDGLYNGFTD